MSNKKVYAFIFARGGSKGLPGKNIKPLAGKPLIAYSVELALASEKIDRVIVSTDNEDIAKVAMSYGAEVPFIRPDKLAEDQAAEWLAWRHAIEFLGQDSFDVFLSLPTTSPLRSVEDVENCLKLFEDESTDFVVTMRAAERSPYFNMVVDDKVKGIQLVSQDGGVKRRQDAPLCYDLTTVAYVTSPEFIMKKNSIWDGKVSGCLVPKERAVDIDDKYDFDIAELFMNKRLAGEL
jgi:N-acylneuraminate cytidylyltransferase